MFAHVDFLCRDFMGMESTKVIALLREYQPCKKDLLHVLKTQGPEAYGGEHQATVNIGQHRVTVHGVEVYGVMQWR
ncbi:hypothetical protein FB192DRAFT_1443617 [Mucor lusitanicus]|uniref:Uncharacterized protein n=2 Tax=Mucor circinelloides f. lusitanicus TaxID=29924 RepID=A0A168MQA3_MUCCL|nr:hypothetical protein FB192DRAFT_1443617 [Mucor lusitanicus]OAD05234.1 hypothetical protein MUCCIDRAFT_109089 [Mucor lusitanicus CBS 277.49]